MDQNQLNDRFRDMLVMTDNPDTPFTTGSRVLSIALDAIREYGCENKDAIIAAAKTAYDSFVRPIDIPYLPEAVEVQLENAVGDILITTLKRLSSRICDLPDGDEAKLEFTDPASDSG